jgi:hypothetical protein
MWPPQFKERHAAPIEQIRVVGREPQPLLVACQRTRKIAQREEGKSETGKAFGTGEIALQRFLKAGQCRVQAAATVVNLAKPVQGIKTVRLLLEIFAVKPFGFGEIAVLKNAPGASQRARRICVIRLHEAVAHAPSNRRRRSVCAVATLNGR